MQLNLQMPPIVVISKVTCWCRPFYGSRTLWSQKRHLRNTRLWSPMFVSARAWLALPHLLLTRLSESGMSKMLVWWYTYLQNLSCYSAFKASCLIYCIYNCIAAVVFSADLHWAFVWCHVIGLPPEQRRSHLFLWWWWWNKILEYKQWKLRSSFQGRRRSKRKWNLDFSLPFD